MKKTTSVTCPRCLTDQNAGHDPLFSECSTCGHQWSHPAAEAPEATPEPPPEPVTPIPTPGRIWVTASHVCTRCHAAGRPRSTYVGSAFAIGLVVLGLFALVGGFLLRPPSAMAGMALLCTGFLVSSLESGRRAGPLCRTCETGPLVPIDTPAGRSILRQNGIENGQ